MTSRHATLRKLRLILASAAIMGAVVFALVATPAARAQTSYASATEAVDALVTAVRSGDRQSMLGVLGPNSADVISSGDPVADAETRQQFLEAYDAKHQIVAEGDDKARLVIGSDDFSFPIPIVSKDKSWQFDVAAGRDEILARRIGRNELNAIEASLAYVDAQNEYAERGAAGNGVYAQRIVSRPGRKDGLYWPTDDGEDESPLGALFAAAVAKGYRAGQERAPYHGYYFRILTRQGPSALGGTIDYRAHGRMIGGFALVAYPAQYGTSGIMTFLVNHQGVVYQKDLGARTRAIAEAMTTFNPNKTWQRVSDVKQSPAPGQ